MRRNLVVVRAGDNSLHPKWLEGAENRSWDLIVSYFGDDMNKYRRPDVTRMESKGPKWPALKALLDSEASLVYQYERIWLPDDDIDCTALDIEHMFEMSAECQLDLCQPALTENSYFSYGITVRNPVCRMRFTNFVEPMIPCFERGFLKRCTPTMAVNLSGWGIEFLWAKIAREVSATIAILDAVSMRHTRPIGAANYGALRERGITAGGEFKALMHEHDLSAVTRIERIVFRSGLAASGASWFANRILWGTYWAMVARAYVLRRPYRWDLHRGLAKFASSSDAHES